MIGWWWNKSLKSNGFLFHVMLKDSLLQEPKSTCKNFQYFVLIYMATFWALLSLWRMALDCLLVHLEKSNYTIVWHSLLTTTYNLPIFLTPPNFIFNQLFFHSDFFVKKRILLTFFWATNFFAKKKFLCNIFFNQIVYWSKIISAKQLYCFMFFGQKC